MKYATQLIPTQRRSSQDIDLVRKLKRRNRTRNMRDQVLLVPLYTEFLQNFLNSVEEGDFFRFCFLSFS
jgi:hypothetical protein